MTRRGRQPFHLDVEPWICLFLKDEVCLALLFMCSHNQDLFFVPKQGEFFLSNIWQRGRQRERLQWRRICGPMRQRLVHSCSVVRRGKEGTARETLLGICVFPCSLPGGKEEGTLGSCRLDHGFFSSLVNEEWVAKWGLNWPQAQSRTTGWFHKSRIQGHRGEWR